VSTSSRVEKKVERSGRLERGTAEEDGVISCSTALDVSLFGSSVETTTNLRRSPFLRAKKS